MAITLLLFFLVQSIIHQSESFHHHKCDSSMAVPSCRSPAPLKNGQFSPKKSSYQIGDIVNFMCNDGFSLVGKSWATCVYNFEKMRANFLFLGPEPTCNSTIECPRLSDPRYGSVRVNGLQPGSVARYKCNSKFKLSGNPIRSCQSDGQWSGKAPTCIHEIQLIGIRCPRLRSPAYGSVRVSGTSLGSRAFYSCDPGFGLYGRSVRRCFSNGKWSRSPPTCRRQISCGKPPAIRNGHVRYTGTGPGAKALHRCRSGYVLRRTSVRWCLSTGHWSRSTPYCVRSRGPLREESKSISN